ncbi:hypothetical protein GKZ28_01605 [Clostridium chromiireducens]|uniref:Cthe-2314-like HEPN domain-containing protein n=1 Tax=Clostridium chromiireducens TaxID=225345 RepID=A0A964RIY5_9CLOT|nr:Cthe_2314 family HEPN domain-containing protein [Clostridium chromiireducens]MVX62396.1 hypothetical protein [Clostridium chromiireducens]
MERFKSDRQVIEYIKYEIENINYLTEHRLYREEQLQLSRNVFKIRNSVEWIIRINKILKYIKYSVLNSLKFAVQVENPMDENKIKDMYTYYLEDSVYRLMVLWDMYKQLVNEFYEVGFNKDENYTIFRLKNKLKKKHIWEENKVEEFEYYLNSKKHKFVREYLRNKFTHSVDPTASNIFHNYSKNGLLTFDMNDIIPKHPYENLLGIVDDFIEVVNRIKDINDDIEEFLSQEIMIVNVKVILKCNKEREIGQFNIKDLMNNKDKIGVVSCEERCANCKYMITYEGKETCNPKTIKYYRIFEDKLHILNIADGLMTAND